MKKTMTLHFDLQGLDPVSHHMIKEVLERRKLPGWLRQLSLDFRMEVTTTVNDPDVEECRTKVLAGIEDLDSDRAAHQDVLGDVLSALEYRVIKATSIVQLTQAARELESLTANRVTTLRHRHGTPKPAPKQAVAEAR